METEGDPHLKPGCKFQSNGEPWHGQSHYGWPIRLKHNAPMVAAAHSRRICLTQQMKLIRLKQTNMRLPGSGYQWLEELKAAPSH